MSWELPMDANLSCRKTTFNPRAESGAPLVSVLPPPTCLSRAESPAGFRAAARARRRIGFGRPGAQADGASSPDAVLGQLAPFATPPAGSVAVRSTLLWFASGDWRPRPGAWSR
jgi:hypothetical protein